MPYGISPAPEYFQQKLDQNLQGLPSLYRIADDLLITGQGDTKEEADKDHDTNLVCLLQRCRERNIKLNKAKFDFKYSQVPDPKKIEAIVNMETSTDVQGVQRLIGMVRYLSRFLSNLSESSGSGPRNKRMPSSLSKLLLHKPQSSSTSVHKLKLKDKVMRIKMASDLF